ncbi:MAG: PepSY-associated TM helix domain-containing protein [Rhodospirillales bacterium]
MKNAFRQSMGWLHTWAGLVVGWVLFFMFLTGTAGYFDVEIDRWMQPERSLPQAAMPAERAAAVGLKRLAAAAPGAERWFIGLPGYRSPDLRLFWRMPPGPDGKRGATGRAQLDAATGEPLQHRDTGGGQLLYRMHYDFHYMPHKVANWIAGVCTMFMLIAIVTGIVIHKRIFADFFTFRSHKGQRSWLDAHNVLSVLALPYHLMITYSGLIFFAYLYMAPVVAATYGAGEENRRVYFDELSGRDDIPERAGPPAALAPLGPLVKDAERRMGAGGVHYLNIYNPGDANARVVIAGGELVPSRKRTKLRFDGTTGTLLRASNPHSASYVTWQTLLGLHEGLFAGPALRWLYFLTALMGTAMIGAGLVLWTAKRRAKTGGTVGFRLVEKLNIGTVAGLPIAVAAFFWANRLIPVGLEGRAAWEAHAMFIVWASMLLHAFFRPASRAWGEQLWLAAGAFGLLPLLNALTTDKHLGVTLPARAWELAGFDLTMFGFGAAFAWVALSRMRKNRRSAKQTVPA